MKIAYLNSAKILEGAPGADSVKAEIDKEMAKYQGRIQSLQDSLQMMYADYQKQSVLLSPAEKKKREDAIEARRQVLAQRAQFLQDEANNRQHDMMDPITKKVEGIIETLRKEGGYSIIFDAASQAMVSADTTLDLTTQVMTRLKGPAATAAKK